MSHIIMNDRYYDNTPISQKVYECVLEVSYFKVTLIFFVYCGAETFPSE